jgi:hypothetical protein
MLVKLGVNFGAGGEANLLVGLTPDDVERLRAGEELSFRPRDAGLVFREIEEGREIVIALGGEEQPKQGRLRVTESMITWMRDTTPLSNKLEDLGFPEGKLILIHGKSDEDTALAVRRYQEMLARTLIPDTSVVATIALDKTSGRVSITRSERGARPVVTRTDGDERLSWAPILVCAVGSVATFSAAFSQHDAVGRGMGIAIGALLAGVGVWALRKVLRHRA